jgi:hypothetical protein
MRAVTVDDHPTDWVIALRAADLTSKYRIDHGLFFSAEGCWKIALMKNG